MWYINGRVESLPLTDMRYINGWVESLVLRRKARDFFHIPTERMERMKKTGFYIIKDRFLEDMLWSTIFVTLMANKIGGLQFGIYRNCQISSRVFHTAVAALPLTKANRSDFE